MNVIFLDFDGVLLTYHKYKDEDIKKKIIILAYICKKTNSKVVISSTHKDAIDKYTLTSDVEWINNIIILLKKYNVDIIDTTDLCERKHRFSRFLWKDDEIRKYLFLHKEIDHYCILDDNSELCGKDLIQCRSHLVSPIDYSKNYEEEGLQLHHLKEIQDILLKENEIKKYALKRISK